MYLAIGLVVGAVAGTWVGRKLEAAAWKQVLRAKGFAVTEFEKLREAL